MSIDDAKLEDWDDRRPLLRQGPIPAGGTLIRDKPKRDKPHFEWDMVNEPHYRVGESRQSTTSPSS